MKNLLLKKIILIFCIFSSYRSCIAKLPTEELQDNLVALQKSMATLKDNLAKFSGPTGLGGLQTKLAKLTKKTPPPVAQKPSKQKPQSIPKPSTQKKASPEINMSDLVIITQLKSTSSPIESDNKLKKIFNKYLEDSSYIKEFWTQFSLPQLNRVNKILPNSDDDEETDSDDEDDKPIKLNITPSQIAHFTEALENASTKK